MYLLERGSAPVPGFKLKGKHMRNSKVWIPAILGIAAFLFFATVYPYHLRFSEQYQMFLFTGEYFLSFMNRPGGFAAYIGAFLTQFAYIPVLGALVNAALIALTAFLSGLCIEKALSRPAGSMQILPAATLFCMMCNENFKLAGAVAFVMILIFLRIMVQSRSAVVLVLGQALLYWLAGGMAMQAIVLLPVYAYMCGGKTARTLLICASASGLCLLAAILLCQYPPMRLLFGTEYFRYPVLFAAQWLFCLAMILPLVICRKRWMRAAALLGCAVAAVIMPDMKKERTIRYDYLAYRGRFKEIIEMAEKKTPQTRIQMNSLNLALAATSKVNRLYDFPQNGVQGIMPPYRRDFVSTLTLAEILWRSGQTAAAQVYVFEAQECIPDYQKSARCYMRLAETAIVMGTYEVAEKYLSALSHTLFYSGWARNAMAYLGNEQKIASHDVWGRQRDYMYDEDFYYDVNNFGLMLYRLVKANPNNVVAQNLLTAYQALADNN